MVKWRAAASLLLLQLFAGAQAAEELVVGRVATITLDQGQQLKKLATESEGLEATSMLRHVLEESLGWECRPVHPDQIHETRRHT